MKRSRDTKTSPLLSLRTYNILADGFTSPFQWYASAHLPWGCTPSRSDRLAAGVPGRRAALLAALTAPVPGGGSPTILAVQELQSTSRGWGRFRVAVEGALAADGGDHALWLRLALAARGYGGAAYSVKIDDALDTKPHHDLNLHGEWPCAVSGGAGGAHCSGARPGVALFWREDEVRHVATREVSFASIMRSATGGEGPAWKLLSNWATALLVLLRHAHTGALVLVGTVHMPTPGSGGGGGGAGADVAGIGAPRGVVQQVQYGEALCTEVAALLGDLGLRDRVPVLLCGDLNALPGTALHRLLTTGFLPDSEACLRLVAPRVDSRWAKGSGDGGGGGGGGGGGAPLPLPLPFPAPTCAGGGAFESAYAKAGGGAEPPFTNFRRLRREVPRGEGEDEGGGEGATQFEELPIFEGTLDYILLRNPPPPTAPPAGGGGPPRAELALRAVGPLPSRESLLASPEGAAPNAEHPSDHFPLCAVYEVLSGGEA
jgi:hypothetical protein